jgi:hypothetical protein
MFKLGFALALIVFSLPSLAQNAFGRIQTQVAPLAQAQAEVDATLPGSLHDTMKAMSRAMKSIEVDDASKNVANAEFSDQIATLSLHSKSFVPDSIAEMPAAQRGAALDQYKKMMDEAAATARSMAAAFRRGDNKTAASLYDQLHAEKKRGHGEYK